MPHNMLFIRISATEIIVGKDLGSEKTRMLVEKSMLNEISFGNGETCHVNFVRFISKMGNNIFRGTCK